MFYHKLLEMTKPIILRSVSNCAFKTQLKRVSYVVSPTLSLKKNFVSDLEELKSVPVCTHVCICEQSHLKKHVSTIVTLCLRTAISNSVDHLDSHKRINFPPLSTHAVLKRDEG